MKKSSQIIAGTALALLIAQGGIPVAQATAAVYGPPPRLEETPAPRSTAAPSINYSKYFNSIETRQYGYGDTGRTLLQIVLQGVNQSVAIKNIGVSWTNAIEYNNSMLNLINTMVWTEKESNGDIKINVLLPNNYNYLPSGEGSVHFRVGWEEITVYYNFINENNNWNIETLYFFAE